MDHITIYIINLASAEKRRIRMIEQCRLAKLALGEDVEFFTAICGNALSEQQKNCQDFKKQYRKYGHNKTQTPNAIACYLSHYELIKRAAQSEDITVIFEDDVEFSPDIKNILMQLPKLKTNWDLISLNESHDRRVKNIEQIDCHHKLVRLYYTQKLAYSYALTPQGARKLLPHLMPIIQPFEILNRYWEHNLNSFTIRPDIAKHLHEATSTIGNRPHRKPEPGDFMGYLLSKYTRIKDSVCKRVWVWLRTGL